MKALRLTMPGLSGFTRILFGPSSFASKRVIASTAPFVALVDTADLAESPKWRAS